MSHTSNRVTNARNRFIDIRNWRRSVVKEMISLLHQQCKKQLQKYNMKTLYGVESLILWGEIFFFPAKS
jgi:hypothetical protein